MGIKIPFKNIAISGDSGTGKTTLARNISVSLGWKQLSAGEFVRDWYKRKDFPVSDVDKIPVSVDRKLDGLYKRKLQSTKNTVFEARLAGFLAKNNKDTLKILCTANLQESVKRVAKRENISFAKAKREYRERSQALKGKFRKLYKVDNYLNPDFFDLVVDTTTMSKQEVLESVLDWIKIQTTPVPEGIFKSYDIRGVYPKELNEENSGIIAASIYRFFQSNLGNKGLNIVLGRDMRLSSPSLFKTIKKTLVDLGAKVIDIGLVSTPTFYFTVHKFSYDGGIQISASHNPKEYNGLKIVMRAGDGLIKVGKNTGMEDIKFKVQSGKRGMREAQRGSTVKITGVVQKEVENAFKIARVTKNQLASFKVVADPANAMGATYITELFKEIPGKLIKMNFRLDGSFPAHQPDPLQPETLRGLQQKVVEEKADLGLAPDGDGDRIFFIDEKGAIVPPSVITAIVAKELLNDSPGEKILFDIRYVLTPKRIIKECGGRCVVTKVGHAFITEAMLKEQALFAGESSGHYYFRVTGGTESSVSVIILILKVLSREKKPFSQIVQEYTKSRESGEINFRVKNAHEIIKKIKNKYSDGKVSELDGVAVEYPHWRFSIRTSNTEPLLRLNVEEDLDDAVGRDQELIDIITRHAKF